MRVSMDEVLRMAQWLLRARSIQCGNEDEPAAAVQWLAARMEGVLEALHGELEQGALARGCHGVVAPRIINETQVHLEADAGNASALTLGPLFLDWLVAAPEEAVLEISGLCSPGWLLPHLAARPALSPVCIEVRGGGRDDPPLMRVWRNTQSEPGLALNRPWAQLWGLAVQVRMSRTSPESAHSAAVAGYPDVSELQIRADRAGAHGVQVDPDLWQALGAIATEAMVPESDTSRARGAGAGDDRH